MSGTTGVYILIHMTRRTATGALVSWLIAGGSFCCFAQTDKKPCEFITKAEAESILGQTVQLSKDNAYQCLFVEPGFINRAPKNKQVSLSIWRSQTPLPNDWEERRKDLLNQKPPQVAQELTDFADGAMWSPVAGAFYAFKGGTIQVAVTITGIPEAAALQNGRTIAARVFGGPARTGYVYVGAPKGAATASVSLAPTAAPPVAAPVKPGPPPPAAPGVAKAAAPIATTGGKTFSQSVPITVGQFVPALREVGPYASKTSRRGSSAIPLAASAMRSHGTSRTIPMLWSLRRIRPGRAK